MPEEKNSISQEQVPDLQGSLSQTEILDVLQFLNTSCKTGELLLKNLPQDKLARVYFQNGELVHAMKDDLDGMDVLRSLPSWDRGDFLFLPDILTSKVTVELPFHHVILEVARCYDEMKDAEEKGQLINDVENEEELKEEKDGQEKTDPVNGWRKKMATLNELLEDLVRIEGINTAVLVGRDGFVIDGVVSGGRLDVEDIGAVISTGIGSSEVMGNELGVGILNQTMVEFEKGIILINLAGDSAILAVVADLKTPLGNVRYQVKKRLPDIMESLEQ